MSHIIPSYSGILWGDNWDNNEEDWLSEWEDEMPPKIPKSENRIPKCECGAHATSFPTFHSDWCPMHKNHKPSKPDDGKKWF